jgi:extracellular elastinolytic metalloproteinase
MHGTPSARRRPPTILVTLAVAVALAVPAAAVVDPGLPETSGFLGENGVIPDVDTRRATIAPSEAQLDAAAELGATARWTDFGTAQSLIRYGGFLSSGIEASTPQEAALAFIGANRELYRLDAVDGLEVATVAPIGDSAFVVVFRQRIGGLPVSPEGSASVGVVRADGAWNVGYASSTLTGGDTLATSADLSPVEALDRALADVGEDVSPAQIDAEGVTAGWRHVDVEGLGDDQLVRRVAFPTSSRGVRVAYETVYTDGIDAGYRHFIDAESGQVLFREESIEHLAPDNPRWKVFPANPPLTTKNSYPYNYPSGDTREIWCWEPAPGCDRVVANGASPLAWDVDPATGLSTNTTIGNNATTSEQWVIPPNPPPPTPPPPVVPGHRPTSASRDYIYPWTNVWFETGCHPSNLDTPGADNDIDAAVANLFAMHNRFHDWSYNLGFTEAAWNGQQSNFGLGPNPGNDPLIGRAQSGALVPGSRDNANMNTRPDGTSSITNMFLWQPVAGGFYAPCVDGDYDQWVIGHEFTHMIENRMIGKGIRRQGDHAGAMGESEADFTAMEYLHEYRLVPVGGESPTGVGAYVTGNPIRAIRNFDMAFPSTGEFPTAGQYPRINPLNFGAVAYDIVGEQVHADGEIWSATQFDIRSLFLERYPAQGTQAGIACAEGLTPVAQCEGNRQWMQLIFDAYLLEPTAPTFLDARDAILAADVMRFGGANQDILWRGFARRGFGEDASVVDNGDQQPIPSWESPEEDEATLTFVAEDQSGSAVNPDVFVGHYEARATPIDDVEAFVANPEGYEFVAKAPGHGFTRFRVTGLTSGESRTITIRFAENEAASANGAVAAGNGVNHGNLIDETESTNWEDTTAPVAGRQVTVQLPGERTVSLARVSAYLLPAQPGPPPQPAQNRFSALRAFELWRCTAGASGTNPTCDSAVTAGWTRMFKSAPDAFPSTPPRPVAPDLLLRTFEFDPATATHVKLVVSSNQCTGGRAFHGEQDQDPSAQTDCRTTPIANQVRVAELQLFSARTQVDGASAVD